MKRSIDRWRNMSPTVVCEGSDAQKFHCILDAQCDILALAHRVDAAESAILGILEAVTSELDLSKRSPAFVRRIKALRAWLYPTPLDATHDGKVR